MVDPFNVVNAFALSSTLNDFGNPRDSPTIMYKEILIATVSRPKWLYTRIMTDSNLDRVGESAVASDNGQSQHCHNTRSSLDGVHYELDSSACVTQFSSLELASPSLMARVVEIKSCRSFTSGAELAAKLLLQVL